MKNPYRRTTCYSLRGFVVTMVVLLMVIQVGMLVLLVNAITTPDATGVQSMTRLVVGSVALLGLLLVNVQGIYFLTSGWERLWDKPWKVLGQGVGSLMFAIAYAVLAAMGHGLLGGTAEQIMLGTTVIAVLADLVGTGTVFIKVRGG